MMEQNLAQSHRRLEPPREGKFTSVFNGMGNGAMLAGAPFLLWRLYEELKDGEHGKRSKLAMGFVALGTAIGAVMGFREAERLEVYRRSISDEITDMRKEIIDCKKEHATHLYREHHRQAVGTQHKENAVS